MSLKDKYWAVLEKDRAFACRRDQAGKTLEDKWLTENDEGYTLVALHEVGLLDIKYNNPSCPGGCFMQRYYVGSSKDLSKSWFEILSYKLQKKADAVMIDLISEYKINILVDANSQQIPKPLLQSAILKPIEEYHVAFPTVRKLPICIGFSLSHEDNGHAVAAILHIDWTDRTVMMSYYNPWGSGKIEGIYNIGVNVAYNLTRNIVKFLNERFFQKKYAGYDVCSAADVNRPGLQAYEFVVEGERKAFTEARHKINDSLKSAWQGQCTVFVALIFTLVALFPSLNSVTLESDMMQIFSKSFTGHGDMKEQENPYFRIIAHGTGNLTRVFSLTLFKYAKQEHIKGLWCCNHSIDEDTMVDVGQEKEIYT